LELHRIADLSLDFAQAFPGINMFGVVSFLTTSRTLGETMAVVTDLSSDEGGWLRESLIASPIYHNRMRRAAESAASGVSANPNTIAATMTAAGTASSTTAAIVGGVNASSLFVSDPTTDDYSPLQPHSSTRQPPPPSAQDESLMLLHQQWMKDLEEILYTIAIWLLSHGIIAHLQEYLVAIASSSSPETNNNKNDPDELLFKELLEMEYLNGDMSIMALSWKLGIDVKKLRSWGIRHKQVRVLSRLPPPSGNDL
jgi:hypothetical protein